MIVIFCAHRVSIIYLLAFQITSSSYFLAEGKIKKVLSELYYTLCAHYYYKLSNKFAGNHQHELTTAMQR